VVVEQPLLGVGRIGLAFHQLGGVQPEQVMAAVPVTDALDEVGMDEPVEHHGGIRCR
jgi:hypothetical protein